MIIISHTCIPKDIHVHVLKKGIRVITFDEKNYKLVSLKSPDILLNVLNECSGLIYVKLSCEYYSEMETEIDEHSFSSIEWDMPRRRPVSLYDKDGDGRLNYTGR